MGQRIGGESGQVELDLKSRAAIQRYPVIRMLAHISSLYPPCFLTLKFEVPSCSETAEGVTWLGIGPPRLILEENHAELLVTSQFSSFSYYHLTQFGKFNLLFLPPRRLK